MVKLKIFLLTSVAAALSACVLFSGCKKEPGANAAKKHITDTLAGQYLVSGSYSTMCYSGDTQYNIPPTTLTVVKIDSADLYIVFQPYFTINACSYSGGYWSGTMTGSESAWWNNTTFTIYPDYVAIQIGTGFNTGYASEPCVGGHSVSGKKNL